MNRTRKFTVSTFGVIAAVSGAAHGAGEILQGSRPPEAVFILA